jgi:hypothetical protein
VDVQRGLARLGAEHHPRSLDEIADVEHLVEEVHPRLGQFVAAEEQLDPPRAVFDVGEGNFAHGPRRPDAPGQDRFYLGAGLLGRLELENGLEAGMRALGAGRIWLEALGAQFLDFLQTDPFERVVVCHIQPSAISSYGGAGRRVAAHPKGEDLNKKAPHGQPYGTGARGREDKPCLT